MKELRERCTRPLTLTFIPAFTLLSFRQSLSPFYSSTILYVPFFLTQHPHIHLDYYPAISTHPYTYLQFLFQQPSLILLCLRWIRITACYITRSRLNNLVRNFLSGSFFKCIHDFKYTIPFSSSKIISIYPWIFNTLSSAFKCPFARSTTWI